MYNALEYQFETKVRQAQVVYLRETMKKGYDEIAEITHYAISTIKNYCRKFADLLDWAKSIFEKIKQKTSSRRSKYDEVVINFTDYLIKDKETIGIEKCYLFEFFDGNGNLFYSKVGTTKKTIWERLIMEIRDYRKGGYDIQRVNINRVWECGSLPAEGLESLIRSIYIKKYPAAFKKNDRFIKTKFDFDECDRVAMEYLG